MDANKIYKMETYLGWPFVLTTDRYGGLYSGGLWLASFGAGVSDYDDGPHGEDMEAMDYWGYAETSESNKPRLGSGMIQCGDTPDEAIKRAARAARGDTRTVRQRKTHRQPRAVERSLGAKR